MHYQETLEGVAISAILRASDIAKEGFYATLAIQEKSGPHDVVTQFDQQAEHAIIETISKAFPHHSFIGEESGTRGNPSSEITWIIDPIDGTWNFARQIPSFACSIAAMKNFEVILGVVMNPIAGELFIAKKGHGATMNGKPLRTSHRSHIAHSGVSLRMELVRGFPHFGVLRRSGSTVLDMTYIAKGSLEGFIEKEASLWDFAAAMLIIEEAGGMVTTLNGERLSLNTTEKQSIAASNGIIHKELLSCTLTGA